MRLAFVEPPAGGIASFARGTPAADRLRGHVWAAGQPIAGQPSGVTASTVRLTRQHSKHMLDIYGRSGA